MKQGLKRDLSAAVGKVPQALDCGMTHAHTHTHTHTKGFSLWPAMECNTC